MYNLTLEIMMHLEIYVLCKNENYLFLKNAFEANLRYKFMSHSQLLNATKAPVMQHRMYGFSSY